MSSLRLLRITSFILLSAVSFESLAYIEGEARSSTGPINYIVELGNLEFSSNSPGATITKDFNLGKTYTQIYYCSNKIPGPEHTYFKGDSNLHEASSDGYYSLNDYVDIKIKYYIWGKGNVSIPFAEQGNISTDAQKCIPPSSNGGNDAVSGGRGQVIFKLKKPIINGLNIISVGVADMFGRLGKVSPNSYGVEPLAHLTIGNTIFTVKDKCIINNGNPINIEFGTIPNTSKQLNGVNYQQDMQVPIECTGGGFDGNSSVEFAVQPASGVSAFNSDYLATSGTVDRSNLAIAIKDRAGNTVTPNHFYTVPSVSNTNGYKGTWNLVAAPVANQGSTIPEGDFEASATIVARFQ